MKTIWKAPISSPGAQEIEVPAGSELLFAREQFDQIAIWFRCDPQAPKETRKIAICPTGGPVPDEDGRYIGTAALHGGALIFHVFEMVPPPF